VCVLEGPVDRGDVSGSAIGDSVPDVGPAEHAPVWIPDRDATVCMCCQKARFSALVRKHHCRGCGHVVCGSCSRNKQLLPRQSDKPVRVCDACYIRFGGQLSEMH
jgi:hypothetical protein